jgi:hypothetical protein
MDAIETAPATDDQSGSQRRARPRLPGAAYGHGVTLHKPMILLAETGAAFACTILNFTQDGAMLQVAGPIKPKDSVTLVISQVGSLRAEVVWRVPEKGNAGIRFTEASDVIARLFNGALPL